MAGGKPTATDGAAPTPFVKGALLIIQSLPECFRGLPALNRPDPLKSLGNRVHKLKLASKKNWEEV
jgi:hypothetical protein